MAATKKKKSYEDVKQEFKAQAQTPITTEPELLEAQEYEIEGHIYRQDYLTITETIQVTKIIKEMDFGKVANPYDFLELLHDSGALERFLNIVLKGDKPTPIDKIKPRIAIQVVLDFFVLNEVSAIIEIIISKLPVVSESINAVAGMKPLPSSPAGSSQTIS